MKGFEAETAIVAAILMRIGWDALASNAVGEAIIGALVEADYLG